MPLLTRLSESLGAVYLLVKLLKISSDSKHYNIKEKKNETDKVKNCRNLLHLHFKKFS